MEIKTGARLRSTACDTEIIVLRAPAIDCDLRCGGSPMVAASDGAAASTLDPQFADGSPLGKRFADEEGALEVLVTKAGAGSLSIGVNALAVKQPRNLPASD